MRRALSTLRRAAPPAALLLAAGPTRAAECGEGVVDPGEQCDAGASAGTYLDLAPPQRTINCANALCTVGGASGDFVSIELERGSAPPSHASDIRCLQTRHITFIMS